jgi:PBP1b-binding outer membrane lipoprotein LpoB
MTKLSLASIHVWTLALAVMLTGCASNGPVENRTPASSDPQLGLDEAQQPRTAAEKVNEKKLAEPGELDKLLDAKPIALASVKTTASTSAAGAGVPKPTETVSTSKGKFRIQISAESDMDAAQTKKGSYEKQLGGKVDVIFDAPYYKLRWGYFDTKQDAEDKLLELSDLKIQGFVVKQ